MNRGLYWLCWWVMALLDWIPGYCRYYTIDHLSITEGQPPRMTNMTVHWGWRRKADWGFRFLCKLGNLVNDFADEAERRHQERNRSSAS